MTLVYRNGQRDAAGTRRHLSYNNSKLLRKEGREQEEMRPCLSLPLAIPSTSPDHSLREHVLICI